MPVHRVPGGRRQAVFCYLHEIEAWLGRGSADLGDGYGQRHALVEDTLPAVSQPGGLSEEDLPASVVSSQSLGLRTRSWQITLAAVIGLLLAVAVLSLGFWPKTIRLINETQITHDGTIKTHLVSDGRNIYVGEFEDGRVVIAAISADGHSRHEIPTPFIQTLPIAVSGNGRELLALVAEGEEQEKALWVVPVDGSAPRRIGDFLCHAAA
jgi:hypothetical protein